jgi:hypothetical protein
MAALPAPTPITEFPDYAVNPLGGDVMTQDLNSLYDKGDLVGRDYVRNMSETNTDFVHPLLDMDARLNHFVLV